MALGWSWLMYRLKTKNCWMVVDVPAAVSSSCRYAVRRCFADADRGQGH